MPSDNVRRDLRIGLRVLVKEKAFCALAIIVLALGIGGVTTMFSVVNGVMLRGFSFPNAQRLISVNFIDPSSTNFFGTNGQISSMDFEEFRPAQQLLRAPGGLPERLHRERHGGRHAPALHRAPTSPRTSCAPSASARRWGATSPPRTTSPAPRRSPSSATASGSGTSRAPPTSWARACASTARRPRSSASCRRASRFRSTRSSGFRSTASSRCGRARIRATSTRPSWGRSSPGSASIRRNAEFAGFAKRFAEAYPDTNKAFATARVEPLIKTFTPAAPARHAADHAGLLRRRAADRLRQRDEHAVRARHPAGEGAGDPLLAGRHPRAPGPADAHREPARGRHRRRPGRRPRLASPWAGCPPRSATSTTGHPRGSPSTSTARCSAFTVGATLLAAVVSGLLPAWMSSRANVVEALKDGGRGNTSQRIGLRDPRAGRGPGRGDLHPADRVAAAGALHPQPAGDRLRLRHGRHHVRAHGPDGRRLPDARRPAGSSTTGCCGSCGRIPSSARSRSPAASAWSSRAAVRSSSRARSTGRSAIGPTPTSSRSPAASSRSPARGSSRAAPSPRTTWTRSCPWPWSTPPSRGSTSARKARSAAASAPWTATPSQPGPWRTIVGVVEHDPHARALQQPERGRLRLLRPLLRQPDRPRAARAVREPVRHRDREAARRPARRHAGDRAPPPGRAGGREPAAVLRGHPAEEPRRLRGARTASWPRCSRSSAWWRWCWPPSASTA